MATGPIFPPTSVDLRTVTPFLLLSLLLSSTVCVFGENFGAFDRADFSRCGIGPFAARISQMRPEQYLRGK